VCAVVPQLTAAKPPTAACPIDAPADVLQVGKLALALMFTMLCSPALAPDCKCMLLWLRCRWAT
jgi:hypothetical protein